jgi:polysaccharide export outer membrane protein
MTTLAELVGQARPQVRNIENARVILQRGGAVHTVSLSQLYEDSRNDIALVPGDLVTVREDASFVSIMGAVGLQGRIEIIGADFSIIDAVVSARGLAANFADPEGVFLLRRDPDAPKGLRIFEIDLSDPVAILAAAQSPVMNDDVLVASTASFARTRQILSLASQSIGVSANISRIVE